MKYLNSPNTKATPISTNWYIGKININLINQYKNLFEINFSIDTSWSNGSDKIIERDPANPKIIKILRRWYREFAPKKLIKLFINLYFCIFF